MPATSPMSRSMHWMHAGWWQPLRAGAPAGEQRLGRAVPLQAAFPRGRRVHTFSLRPFRPWQCLIHSGRVAAAAAAVEPAAVVEAVAAEAEVVEQAEAALEVGAQEEAVEVAPAEAVRAVEAPE